MMGKGIHRILCAVGLFYVIPYGCRKWSGGLPFLLFDKNEFMKNYNTKNMKKYCMKNIIWYDNSIEERIWRNGYDHRNKSKKLFFV